MLAAVEDSLGQRQIGEDELRRLRCQRNAAFVDEDLESAQQSYVDHRVTPSRME